MGKICTKADLEEIVYKQLDNLMQCMIYKES